MRRLAAAAVLAVAGCAANQPQLVMLNPRTGATADCPVPPPHASSGSFLVSTACLSACRMHGFHPTTDLHDAAADGSMPDACN